MLQFQVYIEGKPARAINLEGAHLIGAEGLPLRSEISMQDSTIVCQKRTAGTASLNLMWAVKSAGTLMLETARLPERDEPYVLNVELAAGPADADRPEDRGLGPVRSPGAGRGQQAPQPRAGPVHRGPQGGRARRGGPDGRRVAVGGHPGVGGDGPRPRGPVPAEEAQQRGQPAGLRGATAAGQPARDPADQGPRVQRPRFDPDAVAEPPASRT